MKIQSIISAGILGCLLVASAPAAEKPLVAARNQPGAIKDSEMSAIEKGPGFAELSVKSAVIMPVRYANVPAEVSGVIEAIKYEKGELIQKDQLVVEISKKRHSIMVQIGQEKIKGLQLALKTAEQNLNFKTEVYSKHYGTRQKLLEAESEVAATKLKMEEAGRELSLAQLNLQACGVKAPFSGYMVERYKEPYEAVNQLDKLFAIADTQRVYAVANVPETLLSSFRKDSRAVFVDASGNKFKGTVDKVEATVCPESKTSKVYIVIENPKQDLKMGMTGKVAKE
jgi:RND family efflux transporter MFP subunit